MTTFESHGYDCVIADPREVTYENNRLMADGAQIHIVYKRVLLSELWLVAAWITRLSGRCEIAPSV